jgi:hypothetical protein
MRIVLFSHGQLAGCRRWAGVKIGEAPGSGLAVLADLFLLKQGVVLAACGLGGVFHVKQNTNIVPLKSLDWRFADFHFLPKGCSSPVWVFGAGGGGCATRLGF